MFSGYGLSPLPPNRHRWDPRPLYTKICTNDVQKVQIPYPQQSWTLTLGFWLIRFGSFSALKAKPRAKLRTPSRAAYLLGNQLCPPLSFLFRICAKVTLIGLKPSPVTIFRVVPLFRIGTIGSFSDRKPAWLSQTPYPQNVNIFRGTPYLMFRR